MVLDTMHGFRLWNVYSLDDFLFQKCCGVICVQFSPFGNSAPDPSSRLIVCSGCKIYTQKIRYHLTSYFFVKYDVIIVFKRGSSRGAKVLLLFGTAKLGKKYE